MPPADRIRVHVLSRDERVIRAGRSLPAEGYEVTSSPSATEAVPDVYRCDIAVIDLERGGFSTVSAIRARSGGRVRAIMLCDRPHDVWLCKQAGADEVLVKPLDDPSALTSVILAAPQRG